MVVPIVVCHHGLVMVGSPGSGRWCGCESGSLGGMELGGLLELLVLGVGRRMRCGKVGVGSGVAFGRSVVDICVGWGCGCVIRSGCAGCGRN